MKRSRGGQASARPGVGPICANYSQLGCEVQKLRYGAGVFTSDNTTMQNNKMNRLLKVSFALLASALTASTLPAKAVHGGPVPITVADLEAAQQGWCDALLLISRTHREGGDAKTLAANIIDAADNYAEAPVLFKPTLAHGEQTFRVTREGALAYFVGGDASFPGDTGFALKPWTAARYENAATYIEGNLGITMGHVIFTDTSGKETKVEKTWVFRRGDDDKLRIVLHKSTIPYAPPAQ